ncbi:hypothetical protein [Parenemella sanctibonifatiensis]|uniref:Uncharacterized protein n=1 Tax=Parenemella sanctibonifatiensis TaxID=2016505 RepID=A0A255E1A8_9ACTN|nr:hypothetical protein [Parenemella sanctibonifatiensis]OYN85120.1 hypothetical protein CGZ92_11710 [Parenemella sanctibonifatiensis]
MLTDYLRDHAFTLGWLGLMAFVWFGWAQEDPPEQHRWKLGVGSGLGLLLAVAFGVSVYRHWGAGSALEGQYALFGVLTGIELVAAGIGCLVLARQRRTRWMAWWVALVVALHFVPLAFLLDDTSLLGVAVAQLSLLGGVWARQRSRTATTSFESGVVMGGSLLMFAIISVMVFVVRWGSPW